MNPIAAVLGIFSGIKDYALKREERKALLESAKSKLAQTNVEGQQKQELTDAEWEVVAAAALDKSWKDEYVTVSVVSIFNLIVLGGLAAAWGHVQILQGMAISINALEAAGVDVGFLLNAVVLSAIGLKVWRYR
jgi:hypothetical protein